MPCNKNGFTLPEIIVVALIMGILAAAAIPAYRGHLHRARVQNARATIQMIASTIVQTHDEGNSIDADEWGHIGMKNPGDETWSYSFPAIEADTPMDESYRIVVNGNPKGPMKGNSGAYYPMREYPGQLEGVLK